MILQRWNCQKHHYEDYYVPDHYKCILYTNNMNDLINCPHCGKEIKYGDSYTSLEFHNGIGLGYPVCESCYKEEYKRKINNIEL